MFYLKQFVNMSMSLHFLGTGRNAGTPDIPVTCQKLMPCLTMDTLIAREKAILVFER